MAIKVTISLEDKYLKLLDRFCQEEMRSRTNMVQVLIQAYANTQKTY